MKISVPLSKDGYLPDKYSKYSEVKKAGQPVVSFPITIQDMPADTDCLAISLIDYDAVPFTGFPFIHWLIANVPAQDVKEDLSRNFEGPQGMNSWYSRFYKANDPYVISHYAGPMPPSQSHQTKAHCYTLTVYALKQALKLKNGFFYNDFRNELNGNVLTKAELTIKARS